MVGVGTFSSSIIMYTLTNCCLPLKINNTFTGFVLKKPSIIAKVIHIEVFRSFRSLLRRLIRRLTFSLRVVRLNNMGVEIEVKTLTLIDSIKRGTNTSGMKNFDSDF